MFGQKKNSLLEHISVGDISRNPLFLVLLLTAICFLWFIGWSLYYFGDLKR